MCRTSRRRLVLKLIRPQSRLDYRLTPPGRTGDRKVNKGQSFSVINSDVCEGCPDCVPRCRFEAIKIRKDTDSDKKTAFIDLDRCVGCGQWVIGCEVDDGIRPELRGKMAAAGTK